MSCATCSFVSGPRRYDIAQRVANSRGRESFALTRAGTAASAGRRSPRRARRRRCRPPPSAALRAPAPCRSRSAAARRATCPRSTSPCSRGRRGSGSTSTRPTPNARPCLRMRQDRLLGRRRGGRRHVAEHLVHVGERAQVGGAGLAAHPRDELREDERDDELPLLLREVREVDDRGARLASGGEEQRLRGRGARPAPQAANDGEATSALSLKASSVRSFGGKNASTRRRRACGAVAAGPRRSARPGRGRAPPARRSRSGSRAARARGSTSGSAWIPTSAEQARHRALDLVAQRLGLGRPTRARARAASRRR